MSDFMIGLTVFVQMFGVLGNLNEPMVTIGDPESWIYFQLPFGRSILAGGLTLMLEEDREIALEGGAQDNVGGR